MPQEAGRDENRYCYRLELVGDATSGKKQQGKGVRL